VDEPTLGAPLAVEGRVRHGTGRDVWALAGAGQGLVLAAAGEGAREPTLDGTGTLSGLRDLGGAAVVDAAGRWRAWGVVTLAYLAGLADAAVAATVAHVRSREQFGAPLASLPAVQARLADAALARDGLLLSAWSAAAGDEAALPVSALAWAGAVCREAAAAAHQLHGAAGFALETGVHRFSRRAKTVQAWADAVGRATAAPGTRPRR
jgi:hypothetical protein